MPIKGLIPSGRCIIGVVLFSLLLIQVLRRRGSLDNVVERLQVAELSVLTVNTPQSITAELLFLTVALATGFSDP